MSFIHHLDICSFSTNPPQPCLLPSYWGSQVISYLPQPQLISLIAMFSVWLLEFELLFLMLLTLCVWDFPQLYHTQVSDSLDP